MMNKVTILKKEMIAEMSLLFTVSRPDSYQFTAGQYCEIVLPGLEDLLPKHYFSMVSPTQNIKELSFLARIRDSKFKNKLMNMNIGEEMEISQSDGLWTLECSTKRNVMFIVGGVGVAPVMSIVNSATSSVYNFALLSSNRSQAATPFYKELYQDWHNKKCSTYFAFTRESSSLDRIFNKRIDESMISNVLKTGFPNNQFADICFYICGGSEFVVEIRRLLLSLAINVNDIKLDLFTGY